MLYYYNKKDLTFQKVRNFKLLSIPVIFTIVTLFIGGTQPPTIIKIPDPVIVKVCERPSPKEQGFSEEQLISYIKELNIRHPYIVLAQAKVESNNYKSTIFKENHNLFGMKEARVRPHTSIGTRRNHAYYSHWKESVIDYSLWQTTQAYDLKSESEYYAYLSKNYAEAIHYVRVLKDIVNRDKQKDIF